MSLGFSNMALATWSMGKNKATYVINIKTFRKTIVWYHKMTKYATKNYFYTYLEHGSNSRASSKHAKCSNLARLVLETALAAVSFCKPVSRFRKDSAKGILFINTTRKAYLGSLYGKIISNPHLTKMVWHPSLWIHLIPVKIKAEDQFKRVKINNFLA